ncbi:hypothetical protein D3C73_1129950 [compost metagenome]
MPLPRPPLPLTRRIAASAPSVVHSFSMRLPTSWTPWVTISWRWSAAKPRCLPPVSKVSAVAPAARCACSPRSCAVAIFMARASTRRCRNASLCHARTYVSTASAWGRWPYLARATSPWLFQRRAAIPHRLSRQGARWCSRPTAATWQRPSGSRMPSSAPRRKPACRQACST